MTMPTIARFVSIVAILGVAPQVGCVYEGVNTNHCVHNGGDVHCGHLFDFSRPYCVRSTCKDIHADAEFGCVTTKPAILECWSPCGGASSGLDPQVSCVGGPSSLSSDASSTETEDDGSTTAVAGSTSALIGTLGETTLDPADGSSTGTTLEMGTSGVPESSSDEGSTSDPQGTECAGPNGCEDPSTPFCVSERCVSCQSLGEEADEACAALDANHPFCSDLGCVACTASNTSRCRGMTPHCDLDLHECVPCTAHEQCGAAACNLETGTCLNSIVYHVNQDPSAGCSNAADQAGGITTPLCSISNALSRIAPNRPSTVIVHAPSTQTAYGSFTIVDGQLVAIRSADFNDLPTVESSNDSNPAVTIGGGGTLAFLSGLRIRRSGQGGIRVEGATAHFDRLEIDRNFADGISASAGATLYVTNVFVTANGDPTRDFTGIRLAGSTTRARMVYTTIVSNFGNGAGADSLRCEGGAQAELRNSIVIGMQPNSIACTMLQASFNATDQALGEPGNHQLPPFDASWFPRDDFSIIPGEPFQNVARWRPGDPEIDFDGDLRPFGENVPDYAGADRPAPP